MKDPGFQPSLGGINAEEEVSSIEIEPEEVEETIPVVDGIKTFACPRCKAIFSTDNELVGSSCIYCGGRGTASVGTRSYANYEIIPFTSTIMNAKNVYKNQIKMNPFVPFSFRGKSVLRNMKKIYLVCNYYNFEVTGNLSFLCAEKVRNVKGAPSQTFETMYSTNMKYDNIITSQYSKIGDELLSNINNYNFTGLQPFVTTDAVILGGDVDSDMMTAKMQDKISKHAIAMIRGSVNHSLKKVDENKLSICPSSNKKILVPIYYLNLSFNGKEHFFLMNGQTGASMIDLPISGASVAVFSLIVFAVIFLISFLIAYMI